MNKDKVNIPPSLLKLTKKWWFWAIIAFFVIGGIGYAMNPQQNNISQNDNTAEPTNTAPEKKDKTVQDDKSKPGTPQIRPIRRIFCCNRHRWKNILA